MEDAGEGGQANVYRVVDRTGELKGDFALKRLRNRERVDRFRTEVAAIHRIKHPGVITILDHSDLADETLRAQYYVMPFAQHGDLRKRRALYRDNLDGTIKVIRNIAEALQAAHTLRIIHRDVKPQNILFHSESNELWVSDFGISFLPDGERLTPDGIVVGARGFTAPELEYGGPVEVTAAADVYSLGQVLFFLVSDGQLVSSDVFESGYDSLFEGEERHRLIRALLSKMICGLDARYPDMSFVLRHLDQIGEWESNVQTRLIANHGKDCLLS
jgi:serine/threonine protein kinase